MRWKENKSHTPFRDAEKKVFSEKYHKLLDAPPILAMDKQSTMEKYYTPKIEEFHVGFEYEVNMKILNMGWQEIKFSLDAVNDDDPDFMMRVKEVWNNPLPPNMVRVKYLDKDDIEDCGFEFLFEHDILNTYNGNQALYFSFNKYILAWSIKSNRFTVLWSPFEFKEYNAPLQALSVMDVMFNGFIKNKSELKRLMKQLRINE